MPAVFRPLACLSLIAVFAMTAAPGAAQAPSDTPLRVGVESLPPFAVRTADGVHLGLAMDIWRIAAERLDLDWQAVALEPGTATDALVAGDIDIALPVNATAARAQRIELSQPIYTATMGVATPRDPLIRSLMRGFLSWDFLRVILGLSALLFGVGALVWFFERRRNPDQFGGTTADGLGDGFWWAGVTLTTIGYGDKAPVTVPGRAVAMVWMLIGLAVSSALTATIVNLTDVNRTADLPEDLQGRTVGVIENSTAATFLANEPADLRTFPAVQDALAAMDAGEIERVAFNAPALRAAVDDGGYSDLNVVTTARDPHYVAMALPMGSDLRGPLNAALLDILASESGWNTVARYLPD